MNCNKCTRSLTLGKVIASNGDIQYRMVCPSLCTSGIENENIAHQKLTRQQKEEAILIADHSNNKPEQIIYPPCIVCGNKDYTEYHHVMPRSMSKRFNLDSEWHNAGVYLCRLHHEQWHDIVTWYMNPITPNNELRKSVLEAYKNNIKKLVKHP